MYSYKLEIFILLEINQKFESYMFSNSFVFALESESNFQFLTLQNMDDP